MIHLYWNTPTPSDDAVEAAQRWQALLPDETVRLWTPLQLPELHARITATWGEVERRDHARHQANVVRWWALGTHGGTWADVDVTPLRPLPGAWEAQPWSAALCGVPTPFLCGGPAGAPLWGRALAASLERPRGASAHASGGLMLARIAHRSTLILRPANAFARHDASGAELADPDHARYSDHAWRTSRIRQRQRRGA